MSEEIGTEEIIVEAQKNSAITIDPSMLLRVRGMNQQIAGIQMQMQADIADYASRNGFLLEFFDIEFNIESGQMIVTPK